MRKENLKRTLNRAFCRACEKHVELKSFAQAADLLRTNINEINMLAENFQLHRLHNAKGTLNICSASLNDVLEKRPTQRFEADLFKTNPSFSNIFIGEIS